MLKKRNWKQLGSSFIPKAQAVALPIVANLPSTINPESISKAQVAETVEAPPSPVTRSTASAQLSERIPDPERFKATRPDLRRFHNAITEKLTVNQDRYPTAVSRMAFVNSRLNDESYKLIQPYIRHGTYRLPDYHDILDILQKAYGDPNEARTTTHWLSTFRTLASGSRNTAKGIDYNSRSKDPPRDPEE
jgi:hypothetical protein